MLRGILLCLLLDGLCGAQTLDEAVRSLAKKVTARLPAGEVARVATVRNLSSLGNAEATRARAVFARALRQPNARPGKPVDVAFTISHNAAGLLLVAEIERGDDRQVEMVEYRAPAAAMHSLHAVLEKRLIREQDGVMLDVAMAGDSMLVLEPTEVVVYARRASGWERTETNPLDGAVAVRDPRGRLEVNGDEFTAFLPGLVCHGVHCESGGKDIRFTAARNTMQLEDWPPVFSLAQVEERGRPFYLTAELDGRTHMYDAARRPVGALDSWGDDFAAIANGCGTGPVILASSASARDAADSVAAFNLVDRKPMQIGDPAEFEGPVTALWSSASGALAIARDLATGHYAAYTLTLNCGP